MSAMTLAECVVSTFALLPLITITRYGRPVTLWRSGLKLIGPPSVLNLCSFSRIAASLAPSVEPPALRIA
jgi:hypothetical protein